MFQKKLNIVGMLLFLLLVSSLLGSIPEEEVLVLTKEGVIVMPQSKLQASLHEIQAPSEVQMILETINTQEIRKAMPEFNPDDTMKIAPDGNIARLPDFSNLFVLRLPPSGDRDSTILLLEGLPQVIYAEKNQRVEPFQVFPNDDYFEEDRQWNLHNEGQYGGTYDADIDAPEAWSFSKGSNSVILGIVDWGVDRTHIDLGDKVFGDEEYSDYHGTHVAGIAAAKTNNDEGIAGVDWYARINAQDVGTNPGIPEFTQGVIDAVNAGSKVINCSWGHPEFSNTLYNAFTYAYQMGVLPVAAMPYPDRNWENPNGFGPWIFTVNASENRDYIANYTIGKRYTDVAAPGGQRRTKDEQKILSTLPEDSYGYAQGTSMAAPHATGVAGLLLAANPDLKNYDLEWIMKLTAEDKGTSGWDEYFGYGRLNAYEAVKRALPPYWVTRGSVNLSQSPQRVKVWFTAPPIPGFNYSLNQYFWCDRYPLEVSVTFSKPYEEVPWGWFSLTGFSSATVNNCREYLFMGIM